MHGSVVRCLEDFAFLPLTNRIVARPCPVLLAHPDTVADKIKPGVASEATGGVEDSATVWVDKVAVDRRRRLWAMDHFARVAFWGVP